MFIQTFFVLLIAFAFVSPNDLSASEEEARQFVSDVANNALAAINDKSLNNSQKEESLKELFSANVDTGWMGRFVLGKYYRTANDVQRQKYKPLYHEYLMKTYIPKFRNYTGEDINILKVHGDDAGQYRVYTKLSGKGGKADILVAYRLYKANGDFKIIDIIGEGISLITTQRSDFGGMISRKGIDYFIKKLEAKVKTL